ncbi:hypothetical protein [Acanthopleuribacter pedis]|uniref:DUF4390 domain-containing protein n=1 Tax=Acanthopleuribacter pedis TaxID=442870 RepID=A0A8J7U535_9BACT|nr:hypothetical protein [Acanthopleuribacter pedis]MBO1320429.1 hypothetical protein [Acanthopleuribacter pedis]
MLLPLLFWCTLWRPIAKPPLQVAAPGVLKMVLPDAVWEDEDLRRRLFSGLTTTIELETELPHRDPEARTAFALMEIRYDVWEEQLLVRTFEPGGSMSQATLKDVDALRLWLKKNPLALYLLDDQHLNRALTAKVRCRIIPFSKLEQEQTMAWFANLGEAQANGEQVAASRGRLGQGPETDRGGNDFFRVLMTTSIERRSVVSFRWRYALTLGASFADVRQ